jgi:hypothetical protein
VKAGLRGERLGLDAGIRKDERPKINYLSFHLRKLEKEQKIKSNEK